MLHHQNDTFLFCSVYMQVIDLHDGLHYVHCVLLIIIYF